MGSMRVDLRDLDLPPGRTDLRLDIGMGEIKVLVPESVCVTTEAEVGVGVVNTGDGDQGGVDLDIRDKRAVAPGVAQLHVIADVGVGAVLVGDRFASWDRPGGWHDDGFDALQTETSRAACRGTA